MLSPSTSSGWIAANDRAQEGNFTYGDHGPPVGYTRFHGTQPNDHDNDRDCMIVSGDYALWDDVPCHWANLYYPICEKKYGKSVYILFSHRKKGTMIYNSYDLVKHGQSIHQIIKLYIVNTIPF